MMDSWTKSTIGNLCDEGQALIQTGPFGSQLHAHDYEPIGVPVIPTEAIGRRRLRTEGLPKVSTATAERLSRHKLKEGDILFARRGVQATGLSAIVEKEHEGWLCGTGAILLRLNSPDVDAEFLSFALSSEISTAWLKSHAVGAVMPNLNEGVIRRFPLLLPPITEQQSIARILGTLDDKIELNRRMNETLEAMARALFKSWFVDFDPVRAKAEKRQPAGIDAETAALFPSSFEDSALGLIPKGWRAGKVSDVCTTQYGFTASATDEDTGTRFLRVTDMNKEPWLDWSKTPFCSVEESVLPRYKLYVGDVLVSRMADPGKAAIVEENIDAVFASYLVRLKTENLASAYYLFYFLRSAQYLEYAAGATGGSVQANMNAKVIIAADMLIPHAPIIQLFTQKVLPLRQQIVINLQQSRTLAALRDALLPKLLSGEIKVREAEREVEQVA